MKENYQVEDSKRIIERVFPHGMSPLAGMLPLLEQDMSLPQNASNRYISNLLNKGRNDDFELIGLAQQNATHDGIVVGSYYNISLRRHSNPESDPGIAAGVTPSQAARRCMRKFGVTFRE